MSFIRKQQSGSSKRSAQKRREDNEAKIPKLTKFFSRPNIPDVGQSQSEENRMIGDTKTTPYSDHHRYHDIQDENGARNHDNNTDNTSISTGTIDKHVTNNKDTLALCNISTSLTEALDGMSCFLNLVT